VVQGNSNTPSITEDDAELVEHQLAKILASPHFKSAKQMQNFLQYIVRKTLAGKGGNLKQYTIAVESLGFPVDFDSDVNPVVRIKAGRVRDRLDKYYNDEGINDPLVITIPKGSYIPLFDKKARAHKLPKLKKTHSKTPKLAVLCFSDETQDKESNRLLFQITDTFAKELSHFLFSRLVVSIPHADKSNTRYAAAEIRDKFTADYMLVFYIQQLPKEKHVLVCRLVESKTEEVLWSESFDVKAGQAINEQYRIIGSVTAVVADLQQGILHRHWAIQLLENEHSIPEECKVLAYYRYYSDDLSLQSFSVAVDVCEKRLKGNPDDVIANVLYADYCRRDYVYAFGIIDNPSVKGEAAAINSIRLRPDSHEAHYCYGQILFCLNKRHRSLSEFNIARDICQYDAYIEYGVGFHFCLMGEWEEGCLLVKKVLELSISSPGWFNITPFLYYFISNDYKKALDHAIKIDSPNIFHGAVARCTAYAHLGETDLAKEELDDLLKHFPNFMEQGKPLLVRFLGSEEMADKLWVGILIANTSN